MNIAKDNLNKVKRIICFLKNNTKLSDKLNIGNVYLESEIDNVFNDWNLYLSKLEDNRDTEYFKPYWLPIVKDSLFIFFDLSDPELPLFKTEYENEPPFNWHKQYISENIFKTIEDFKNGVDIKETVNQLIYSKKDNLPFIEYKFQLENNNIEVTPIITEEAIVNRLSSSEFKKNDDGGIGIFFNKVNSLLLGLIPYNTKIICHEIEFSLWKMDFKPTEISTIKELIFLIRKNGFENVCRCTLTSIKYDMMYSYSFLNMAYYYNEVYDEMIKFQEKFNNLKSKSD